MTTDSHGHAIVVGGSVAGLLAARVLADRFHRVTLVERDLLDDAPQRAGVPHARHLHVLLRRGLDAMAEILPGFEADLLAAGGELIEQGTEFRVLFKSGWAPVLPGLKFVAMSRALLEHELRRRVLAHPAIAVVHGRVSGLAGDRRVVCGVVVGDQRLSADFVVDASGRNSALPTWLEVLGLPRPRQTVVDAFWGYAMRVYRRPAQLPDWKQLFIMNRPPDQPRCGVLQPIEGGRWLLNLGGVMKDYPPTDEAGFLEFTRSLPDPQLYEAVRAAEPVSRIHAFRHTSNRLREIEVLPARLAVLGDALCAFNPVYGQGMTVAALEVLALRDLLRRKSLDALGAAFQRNASSIIAGPWAFATGEDSRWPRTEGAASGLWTRLLRRYLDRVISVIPRSPAVYARFQAVQHMVASPAALFHPSVLWQMMRRADRNVRSGHAHEPRQAAAAMQVIGSGAVTERDGC